MPLDGELQLGDGKPSRDGHTAKWTPLLEDGLAARALETVRAIADDVRMTPAFEPGNEQASSAELAGGHAGLAILHACLSKAGLADRAHETAEATLDAAVQAVCNFDMPPALYGGFSGVAWAVAHLHEAKGQVDDPNEEIDTALCEYLTRSPWTDEFDLVSGLVGFGVYALERLPRASVRNLLALVVDRLEETAEETKAGITWRTRPDLLPEQLRKECPEGYYNLGLAHGLPGVIALLGGACAAAVAGPKARRLLDGAVEWLLSRKLPEDSGSMFPAWIAPGTAGRPSRSAWCYGDPGIAAALLCAAQAVGDASWEREALEIARRAVARPPDQAGVRDAGLCHGAAGLAHLFNRMYQATGEARLAEAARFWFARTLDMRQPGRGVAGYAAYRPREDGTIDWKADPGLLGGAAGIAMALLSAITPIEPAWDRMLLVSLPRTSGMHEEGAPP
jgi:lantibiotic modifying enzyme